MGKFWKNTMNQESDTGAGHPRGAEALYHLEGFPGWLRVLPFSLQQVMAMFVSNLVPIGLITVAAVPALSQQEILMITQHAMIAAGIATFVQATPIWKIGSGLPVFMGVSFTFVVPLCAIAAKYGYSGVVGTVLAGGLMEGLLGLTVRYWRKLISPIVSALVVMGIGLSLLSTAARNFGGGYSEGFGDISNLVIGFVTVMAILLWTVLVRGTRKQLSILAGVTAGYLTALAMGKVDFSGLAGVDLFELPRILPFKPTFHIGAMISIAIIYLVSATETLGDGSAVTGGALKRGMTREETRGILLVDGLGSSVAGLFGVSPVTSYSECVGLTIMTGVVNRYVARVGALILILAGLFPPVGSFVSTIPKPVIGGVMLMVMGQILLSGVEMIAEAGFTQRNKLISAVSLSIAVGFTTGTEADLWKNFPLSIQTIFSSNVVAVIFVLALFLNLVLPKDMK